jgi:protein TonB
MKIKKLVLLCAGILGACSTQDSGVTSTNSTNGTNGRDGRANGLAEKAETPMPASPSTSLSLTAYQRELALRISQLSADKVYVERPQAMLRSVIVLKYSIDADGKLLRREIVRSNRDKMTETIALASISSAAPFPRPKASLLRHGKLEIMETWLFNKDGRFQLRSIALPQMSG